MNAVQALAVAAAALVITSDSDSAFMAKAEARLSMFAAQVEALVDEVAAETSAAIEIAAAPSCDEGVREDQDNYADEHGDERAKRGLPDAMFHLASRAARL